MKIPDIRAKRPKAGMQEMGFGYRISQTDQAAKVAFELATNLVKDALSMGAQLRTWGTETREKTHQLLKLGENLSSQESSEKPLNEKIQDAITDVIRWENEISASIRSYFMNISRLLNQLKSLDPPLKSEELHPYVEAILSERRATMAALEPLSVVIEKIADLKTQVWFDSSLTSRPSL